jgi:uncharacterized protein with von Willebrand factor type A (vWA) domain
MAEAPAAAGLPVGPGQMLDAIRAVETAGLRRRDDFYWTLHAIFVKRRDQKELFDQAFQIFWRNPELLEKMMSLLMPVVHPDIEETPAEKKKAMRRVAEALARAQAGLDAPVAGGPSRDDVEAAAQMNAADRTAMIETMVANLDQRLRDNPADAEGWRRLVRSYSVLGRNDDARQALERGLKALGPESEAGQKLRDFAGTLGLGAVE